MAHELPPPAVMRSQRNMNSGNGATNDAFGNTDEWQPIDYWYNRVLSKSSPAANTANPSALGLIAFGYTTALLQGANTVWTEASTTYVTIAFALFFGGLVQLLAGMWEFRRNNMFAATALSSYGGFWLSYGIYVILTSGGVIPESGAEGLQMMLCLWGILTFFFFLCTIGLNVGLMVLFLSLAITFFLLAAGVTHTRANKAGGYFGVWTAAVAWYIAFAELLNEVWFRGRVVIPLGSVTWPNKRHEQSMQGKGDGMPSSQRSIGSAQGQTVV
ncbi:hypothetical protein WJX79_007310 [Trebouxia sp. C0005]|nr:MAG: GPR1 FUN34 yaaH family protein [Trebouxia sp. A1-2]